MRYLGVIVGIVICLILPFPDLFEKVLMMGMVCPFLYVLFEAFQETYEEKKDSSKERKVETHTSTATRSLWEDRIYNAIHNGYPNYLIVRNDRSIVMSKTGTPLEIDIYIPKKNLAFECNGEHWHDHKAYTLDKKYGTCLSEEMYKERECAKRGIKLIHLWDSQSSEDICDIINDAIKG